MKKQDIKDKFSELFPKYKETTAYSKLAVWIAECDESLFDRASDAAEEAKYHTVRYGRGFYTTCHHKDLGEIVGWEASRYPKAAATVAFAIKLAEQ